jgi:hypothetical protein
VTRHWLTVTVETEQSDDSGLLRLERDEERRRPVGRV